MNVDNILKVTGGELILGNSKLTLRHFLKTQEQSKKVIYIGIKGEKFDGSQFWKQALDNGAEAVIIQDVEVTEKDMEKYK